MHRDADGLYIELTIREPGQSRPPFEGETAWVEAPLYRCIAWHAGPRIEPAGQTAVPTAATS